MIIYLQAFYCAFQHNAIKILLTEVHLSSNSNFLFLNLNNLKHSIIQLTDLMQPNPISNSLKSLLPKLKQSQCQLLFGNLKTSIINLYTANPSDFCHTLVNLIMDLDLERRQEGMFLLSQVAKPPHRLQLFTQEIIEQAETQIAEKFHQEYGNCTLRYKALGILYSHIPSANKVNIISDSMFEGEDTTLPWLKCLSQFMRELRTCDMSTYQSLSKLFQSFISMSRLSFEQEVEQIFESYSHYIRLARIIAPQQRLKLLQQSMTLLASLVTKFQSFKPVVKGFSLFYDICKKLPFHLTYHLLEKLHFHTKAFLQEVDIIDVWIDLIQELDTTFVKNVQEYERIAKNTFTEICTVMISNIQTIDSWAKTLKKSTNHEDKQFDGTLVYSSAELLISILKRVNILVIKNQIEEKTIKTSTNKISRILFFSISCCSMICKFDPSEFNQTLSEIFEICHIECRKIELEQPNRFQIQMAKAILFGICNLLNCYKDKIVDVKPTLLSGIYTFIIKIVDYELDEEMLQIIRDTLLEVMHYGEKYFMLKSSNKQLKTIVKKFILKPYASKSLISIKDIMADFGFKLLKKHSSRTDKLLYLNDFTQILNFKGYPQGSELNVLCKFCTCLIEELGEFKNSISEDRSLVENFVNWIFRQISSGASILFEPFGVLLKLNFNLIFPMIEGQKLDILANVGSKNLSFYFPLLYENLTQKYREDTSNVLLNVLIKELTQNNVELQKLKKVLKILTLSYRFENFQKKTSLIVDSLFLALNKTSGIAFKAIDGLEHKKIVCQTINSILFSDISEQNMASLKDNNLKYLMQYLQLHGCQFSDTNFKLPALEVEFRLGLIKIIEFFVAIKADSTDYVKTLSGYSLKIIKSIPIVKMIEVNPKVFEDVIYVVAISLIERMKAMGSVQVEE